MTSDDIKAFRAVALQKNFTRAAETLFIPQSSLSKKIAALESEIGAKLFERTKRTVTLTNAGLIFLQESEALLNHEENFLENVRYAAQNTCRPLQVSFMGVGLAKKFLPHIHHFKENFSDFNLQLSVMDFRGIYSALQNNQIDIAITGELGLMTLDHIRTQKIFTAHNFLILPRQHSWLSSKRRDFSALSKENFILLNQRIAPQGYEKVLELCASFGFTPHVVRNCMTIEEILFQVSAGQGITILPNFDYCAAENPNCVNVPVKDDAQIFPIVVAWKTTNKNSGIALFRENLRTKKDGW